MFDIDREKPSFEVDGDRAGDLNSDLNDTVSYSEKSTKESKGSRQLAWELEVDMLDDDCADGDIAGGCGVSRMLSIDSNCFFCLIHSR